MKKYVIVILIILCNSCKSQINKTKMEKFNIKDFRNKELKINEVHTDVKNDTVTKTAEFKETFIKYTNAINNPFQKRLAYFKDNYNLKVEINYFYNFPVGISKEYDKNGNLLKQKNWDENYNFSVQQLIDKMSNEFNLDLKNNNNKIGVARENDITGYFYKIIIQPDSSGRDREIKIDAKTGSLISDRLITYKK